MNRKLLILETSGAVGQAALAEGDCLRSTQRLDETRRHARDLAPTVACLLAQQGWKPHDVHAVLVSQGPGSYTGLRVGIMSAKAFAYATGCTLLGIDTFAAIASQAPADAQVIDVCADAQQDKVYVQRFRREGTSLSADELTIRPLADWLPTLDASIAVSGPGVRRYRERLPADCRLVPEELREPQPASLLQLGLARLARGDSDDLHQVAPRYLRPSSAEEKWTSLGK